MLLIPNIFHQIWLWWKELPRDFATYQKTWTSKNIDWQIKIWREDDIWILKYFDSKDYSQLTHFSAKSDYLRFCIILEYGGIYIDTDFECLQPIEPLLDNLDFFICNEHRSLEYPSISGAIFGSIPEHKIVRGIFHWMHKSIYTEKRSIYKVWPPYVTQYVLKNRQDIKIFPANLFYPIPAVEYHKWIEINRTILIQNGAYWIHHYASSWDFLSRLRWNLIRYRFLRFIYMTLRPIWRYFYYRKEDRLRSKDI